jgi:hypothetical protein
MNDESGGERRSREIILTLGSIMPQDGQPSYAGEAGAEAGASHALIVTFERASDGAEDSELRDAQCRLAFEPDAPPSPEGVRIGVLPGQSGCEGREPAAAEVGVSNVAAEGNSGTPAASLDEKLQVWLKDAQDDGAWRDATVQEMREGEHSYSPEETALIASGTALLRTFASGKGKARPMRPSKTVELAKTKHDEKSGLLIGHVEAEVRTSAEQVVAFLMHFDSKFLRSIEWNPEVDVRREVLEVKSPHHTVVFLEKKTAPFHNRTWLNALLWQKVSDTPLTYVWVTVPIEHHAKISAEDEAQAIRAEASRCIRVTQTAPGVTRIEYACSLDLKGRFPSWLTERLAIPTHGASVRPTEILHTRHAAAQLHRSRRYAPGPSDCGHGGRCHEARARIGRRDVRRAHCHPTGELRRLPRRARYGHLGCERP